MSLRSFQLKLRLNLHTAKPTDKLKQSEKELERKREIMREKRSSMTLKRESEKDRKKEAYEKLKKEKLLQNHSQR